MVVIGGHIRVGGDHRGPRSRGLGIGDGKLGSGQTLREAADVGSGDAIGSLTRRGMVRIWPRGAIAGLAVRSGSQNGGAR
jgi:hypothetical protein